MYDFAMNRYQAADHLQLVWDGTPAGTLCLAVLRLITEGVLKRLTFGQLSVLAAKMSAEEADVARAVQYLTGHDLHLLDMEFEFIDEREEFIYFDVDALSVARREGKLFHPETGDQIEDYEDRIFVTFVPSALAKEISANE